MKVRKIAGLILALLCLYSMITGWYYLSSYMIYLGNAINIAETNLAILIIIGSKALKVIFFAVLFIYGLKSLFGWEIKGLSISWLKILIFFVLIFSAIRIISLDSRQDTRGTRGGVRGPYMHRSGYESNME